MHGGVLRPRRLGKYGTPVKSSVPFFCSIIAWMSERLETQINYSDEEPKRANVEIVLQPRVWPKSRALLV
jgi:hypothetical protein